jgi:hypothetical protein
MSESLLYSMFGTTVITLQSVTSQAQLMSKFDACKDEGSMPWTSSNP